jgi:hypothetical protein
MAYPTPSEQLALNPNAPVLFIEYFTDYKPVVGLIEGMRFAYGDKFYIVKSNTRYNSENQFAKQGDRPLYLECINIPSGKKILATLNLIVQAIPQGFKIPDHIESDNSSSPDLSCS